MNEPFSFSATHRRTASFALTLFVLCGFLSLDLRALNLRVEVLPQYGSSPLSFEKMSLTNTAGQKLSVTRLDFLLSDIALHQRSGGWLEKTNWQAFVSVRDKRTSFDVNAIAAGEYDRIRFKVGLPPEINHAKTSAYPPQHPLNPNVNGLYWGWAGGYVFFAVEGHWIKTNDSSGYSFHLGNDWMLTQVELPLSVSLSSAASLALTLNVKPLFDFELTDATSSTHSRTNDPLALRLQKNLQHAFAVGLSHETAGTLPLEKSESKVAGLPPGTHPYRFTFSSQFPMPELPRDNPLTEEGVELGHKLFGERLLSINNEQSCASCHREENAFSDAGKKFSLGAEGAKGVRNSMPIFNLAWKKSFFWDGRAKSVRDQVVQPIENPIEMHETLSNVVEKLSRTRGTVERDGRPPRPDYPELFRAAFGTPEISKDRIARALEQFVLSQLSFDSKFDRAFDGKAELTEQEKRGFELFVTEYDPRREQYGADCFHCHGGPLFQSQSFANNGLDADFKDLGRYEVTKSEGDKGKFAVPSLRNVELTGPYMHDGRFQTLEEVVEHYATGVKPSATLDPNIAKHPVGGVPLSEADKKALVAFLKTLTEEKLKATNGARR